jgi:serine/threonine protein kinase
MKIKKVIDEIHQGGFGVIHKVELNDGSIVARKTFNPLGNIKPIERDKLKRRFSREVKTQERLPSDLFIEILYSSLDEDTPWFIMPLADYSYEKEIISSKQEGKIPSGISDILNGLEYLHNLGYVHRDLKPGNVLLHEGKWKLADLGLITSDESLTSSFQTSEGVYAGSRDYMAPEQVTNFSGVTAHADIYSFGAILHDIFNGKPRIPFKKLTGSGKIGWIISKCTEENPNRRFNDVKTIRNVLLAHLAKEEIVLSKDENTTKWIEKLNNIDKITQEDFDSFVMYLDINEGERETIFLAISTEIIVALLELDKTLWKQFLLMYFDWIKSKYHNFDYCDVLVDHIYKVFELTSDLEIMSRGALTAAELGKSNNRWYVMKKVVKMCSPAIPDNFASRLNIEIHVEGYKAKENLRACADRINLNLSCYHKEIIEVIS